MILVIDKSKNGRNVGGGICGCMMLKYASPSKCNIKQDPVL